MVLGMHVISWPAATATVILPLCMLRAWLQVGIPAAAASSESSVTTAEVQTGLLEVNKDTFYDFLASAGDSVVVVDFYTNVSTNAFSSTGTAA